jgi:lipopolysaccharide export system protein LptC
VAASPSLPSATAAQRRRARRPGLPRDRGEDLDAARRYSRAVRRLRVALPVVALGIVASIVIWSNVNRPATVPTVEDTGPLEMVNTRYTGVDRRNRTFRITAERAVQPDIAVRHVELENPAARIVLDDGTVLGISAAAGRYEEEEAKLYLNGAVRLVRDNGYDVTTEAAVIDLKTTEARGDRPVAAVGPNGIIDAAGFRITEDGKVISLIGPARLRAQAPADSSAPRAAPDAAGAAP